MKLLLLAGTGEARALAGLLASSDIDAVASLAGATHQPKPLPIPTRSGGFGGEAEQTAFMQQGGFDVVIDATHPFAENISARTQQICDRLAIPYLRLLRPEWQPGAGDLWHAVDSAAQAADLIPQGARVLLATGARSLNDWAVLAPGRRLFCRRAEPTDQPFPFDGGWITGLPPKDVDAEVKLLKSHDISWIVTKNAGGPAGAKLKAARALGLPVVLLRRPARPDCPTVASAEEALLWLANL